MPVVVKEDVEDVVDMLQDEGMPVLQLRQQVEETVHVSWRLGRRQDGVVYTRVKMHTAVRLEFVAGAGVDEIRNARERKG